MGFLRRMLQRTDEFFTDFEQLAAATVESTRLLKALLDDFTEVAAKAQVIKDLENRADDILHRSVARLHVNFITPFDRPQVHRLLSRIDDVVDLTHAASERLSLYEIEAALPDARDLAGVLVEAAETMQVAVHGLRHAKQPVPILEACKLLHVHENRGDFVLRRAMADLFNGHHQVLFVVKWKEILDLIEDAIDRTEDVANVIEGVVLEHS